MATSVRWIAAPIVVVVFVLGVWVTGGLITNDFKASMALTLAWGALFAGVCVAISWRSRSLRVPVLGAFVLSAVVVGGFLAWTTLRDKVVHEQVAVGTPLRAGTFESLEHESHGRAAVIPLGGGRRVLTLTAFSTSPGPDLRVRIVPGRSSDGGAAGARDLGALKGNKGDQQYTLPADADLSRYTSVVIWCRAFSAAFARADLVPA
jgi:hypothetical protein